MGSFRCYDSSDVIAILIMTNFPLSYLIQLWWQFFPNACLWRRSLCSNSAGIDSVKLYRVTLICQYGLFCCMALVSFRQFCKNLGNLQEFFWANGLPPPLVKNCPYAYAQRGRRGTQQSFVQGCSAPRSNPYPVIYSGAPLNGQPLYKDS